MQDSRITNSRLRKRSKKLPGTRPWSSINAPWHVLAASNCFWEGSLSRASCPGRSILALVCPHITVYLYQNKRTALKKARVSDFDPVRTPPGMPKVSISLRTSSKNQKFLHIAFKHVKMLKMHVDEATLTPKKQKEANPGVTFPDSRKAKSP